MRILRFEADNIKRLSVVQITPQGSLITLTGKNKNGKSSVLDAIFYALGGAEHIPDEPLRRGADKGYVRLDLGDIIVERVFRKSGTTELTVRDGTKRKSGAKDAELPKWGSPQEMLDGLLGRMSFDPLAFMKKKPREQFDELSRIAKLSVDIDVLEAQNDSDFKKRTDINRDIKQLKARAEAVKAPDVRPDPVDESALVTELQNAAGHNADIEKRRANRENAAVTVREKKSHADAILARKPTLEAAAERDTAELESQIETLRKRIENRKRQLDSDLESDLREHNALMSQAEELERKLTIAEPLPELVDVATVRQRLDIAKGTNAEVALFDQRAKLLQELKESEAQADKLTQAMLDRDKQKADAIASAEMPIPGLSLDSGRVFFNGFPLDQASDAEQLRVSTAIGMAGNPEIRVMRIKEGGLLDDDGLKLLAELAEEKDWQMWLESVRSDDPMAIVMEDGMVRSADHPSEQGSLLA